MTEALAGLRVLDLSTGPAGGIATMVLADFGANVVKAEPPRGDPFHDMAAASLWLRGKRSVELDMKTPSGQHTRPLLREFGYSNDDVRALYERRIVTTEPV